MVVSLHGSDNADRWQAASGEQTPADQLNNWPQLIDDISGCELIVTVDTAVAHIAGAMGKTTHLLTYDPSDWRWMTGPASDWYPSIQIHRRPVAGPWEIAIQSLIDALTGR
jgi:ADP-heptose:LPS heptosyltransferase